MADRRPIPCTSNHCRSRRQPKLRGSTYLDRENCLEKRGHLYYGIVDHTRRHNEPTNRENGRRVDPVLVIKEVQEAGFELVDFSNLYYRPNDALALEVGNPEVNDLTDRIALLFRRPE